MTVCGGGNRTVTVTGMAFLSSLSPLASSIGHLKMKSQISEALWVGNKRYDMSREPLVMRQDAEHLAR